MTETQATAKWTPGSLQNHKLDFHTDVGRLVTPHGPRA